MRNEIFKKGFALLLKTFPDKQFPPEIAWKLLMDLSDAEFEKAILNILTTHIEIYPNTNIIALIREKAKLDTHQLTAGEAWGEVLYEISRVGHYGCPKFSNPTISSAVYYIGWREMCMSEKIAIERAHFFKVFENLQQRENRERLYINNNVELLEITKKAMPRIGRKSEGV